MEELIHQLCQVNEQTRNAAAFKRAAEIVGDIILNRRGLEAAIALLNNNSTSNHFACTPSSPTWSTKSEVVGSHLIFQPSLPDTDSLRTTSCSMEQGIWIDGKRGLKSTLYKTEMCRNWRESQTCPYGRKCQYAHGEEELRQVARPLRYKTKPCREYYNKGLCNYGQRCHFMHKSPREEDTASLPGDGYGVGASLLESSSGFPEQSGLCGTQNQFSEAYTGWYHPEGNAWSSEFDMSFSPVGQQCSAGGALENQCSTFQPQVSLQHSITFVGCTAHGESIPTWSCGEPQNAGLNAVQKSVENSGLLGGDPKASTTRCPGV